MKILFLTLANINSLNERGIYTDLLRKFEKKGHEVYVISPIERRDWHKTIHVEDNIYKVNILNTTKTNLVEKGISTLTIDTLYLKTIKRKIDNHDFDLVMYSTPPITFSNTIKYLKKRTNTTTYLLLKDIFPQNAVDLNMIKKGSFIHKFFRRKESQLYLHSDLIGCMSPRNIKYVTDNNSDIDNKVHLSPNTIEVFDENLLVGERDEVRKEYNLPLDKIIFIYGGNIGKPQGIDLLLNTLSQNEKINPNVHFLIIGSGTEFKRVKEFCDNKNSSNITVMDKLPVKEFNRLTNAADVGLLLLDYRFSIPNFPSRLLSYMESHLPVLAATDSNTDVGTIIEENGFGLCCSSESELDFVNSVKSMSKSNMKVMGEKGYNYLEENYTVNNSYEIIMNQVNRIRGTENV